MADIQNLSDSQLLELVSKQRDNEAFQVIFHRYYRLVWSACRRRLCGHEHLAEDGVQAVFFVLFRNAGKIRNGGALSVWLYQTAGFVSAKILRTEVNMQEREKKAVDMNDRMRDPLPEASWVEVRGCLDAAIDRLPGKQREAVIMHYIAGKSLGEISSQTGISKATLQRRVESGIGKLRLMLSARNMAVSVAAFGPMIAANSLEAAPAGLAQTLFAAITHNISSGGSSAAGLVNVAIKEIGKMMFIAKLKVAAGIVLATAFFAGTGAYMISAQPDATTKPATVSESSLEFVPDGNQFTIFMNGEIYLKIVSNSWGPGWKFFDITGKVSQQPDGAKRVWKGKAKIPGTDASVECTQTAYSPDEKTVIIENELASDKDVTITGIVQAIMPGAPFREGKAVAIDGSDKTIEMSPSFPRGALVNAVCKQVSITDNNGKQIIVKLSENVSCATESCLRINLVPQEMKAGTPSKTTISIVLPEKTKFFAKEEESYIKNSDPTWFPYPVGEKGPPVDLSFLNKDDKGEYIPAGAHGFVKVKGEDLVFEDGTPARFWGINVTATAVYSNPQRIEQIAERLARLGINIVRLHHLDSQWAGTMLYDDKNPDGTTQNMNPKAFECLDKMIFELKKRGIYVNLDPWVGRYFKEKDGVKDCDKLPKPGNFCLHPYIYFDTRMQELIKMYWKKVWTHVNPLTGKAYNDEPAIVLTEVINEGLIRGGGTDVKIQSYKDELKEIYKKWAAESKADPAFAEKILTQNYGDEVVRFNMDLARMFYSDMMKYLHDDCGVKIPVISTNWYMFTWELAPQLVGDMMDAHDYYGGTVTGSTIDYCRLWTKHSPYKGGGPWAKMAGTATAGRPLSISECGQMPPQVYRAAYFPAFAAVASFQGWDAITGYAFSQASKPANSFGVFGSGACEWESDPAVIAGLAAGSLIYRRADVEPAKRTVVMHMPEKEWYHLRYADDFKLQHCYLPEFNVAIEEHKVVVVFENEIPKTIDPLKVIEVESGGKYVHPNTELSSDTGQLWRDWKKGVGKMDTPRTQAVYGMLGENGEKIQTKDCAFSIKTPYAAVILSSLKNDPLNSSSRLLLTAVARAESTEMVYSAYYLRVLNSGKAPMLAEPVTGEVSFKTSQKALKAYPIKVDGSKSDGIEIKIDNGTATFELKADYKTLFYEISVGN